MTEGLQDEVFGIVNERQLYALGTIEKSANHLNVGAGNLEAQCFHHLAFPSPMYFPPPEK